MTSFMRVFIVFLIFSLIGCKSSQTYTKEQRREVRNRRTVIYNITNAEIIEQKSVSDWTIIKYDKDDILMSSIWYNPKSGLLKVVLRKRETSFFPFSSNEVSVVSQQFGDIPLKSVTPEFGDTFRYELPIERLNYSKLIGDTILVSFNSKNFRFIGNESQWVKGVFVGSRD